MQIETSEIAEIPRSDVNATAALPGDHDLDADSGHADSNFKYSLFGMFDRRPTSDFDTGKFLFLIIVSVPF